MDNLGSQTIFIWWRNSSKKKQLLVLNLAVVQATPGNYISVLKSYSVILRLGWVGNYILLLAQVPNFIPLTDYTVKYSGLKNSMLSTLLLVLCVWNELRKKRSNITNILEKKLCSETKIRSNFLCLFCSRTTFSLTTHLQNLKNKRTYGTKDRLDLPLRGEGKVSCGLIDTENRSQDENSEAHQPIQRRKMRKAGPWGAGRK